MMNLKILCNDKKLFGKSAKVSRYGGIRLGHKLIKFVSDNNIVCAGLAAPQVDIFKRVFIMSDGKEFAIFINPKLIEVGKMIDTQIEKCLSVSDAYEVERPTTIIVKDVLRPNPIELDGWTARVWLHEYDHLNGVLISSIGKKTGEMSKYTI